MAASLAELAFRAAWEEGGGPPLLFEYKFHPSRKWRADAACLEADLLIEIEGGTWVNGRHNRGEGYRKDCEKYNAAALMGWRVVRFTPDMLIPQYLAPVIQYCWDHI